MNSSVKLTAKQEAFAKEYVLNGGDASAAYRKAYDASKMKPESIHRKAKEVLDNGKVAARVKELQSEVAKVAEEKFKVDAAWVLEQAQEIYQVAMAHKPTKVVQKDSIGTGMTQHTETEVYRHDLPAANKALEQIGKHVDVQAWKEQLSVSKAAEDILGEL